MTAVLQLVGVTQQYGEGELSVSALSGVDLAVERGELVAIMGATLTAVGGSRSVRRRINGWQAVIIVGIGSFVGTIAGQLPMWGIAHTLSQMRYWADAPWLWLAVLAVGLPLLVMGVSARAAAASGSHTPHGDRMTRLG